MRGYDCLVVGLGGSGSSVAYHLAKVGLSVAGFDQYGPANNAGSSHGGSRIVRNAYAEGADFRPLLDRAHRLWDELGAEINRPVLRRCGALFLGKHDSAVVAGTVADARAAGIGYDLLDSSEIRRLSPLAAVPDDTIACRDPSAGLVSPEDAVATHLRLGSALGATLNFGEPIVSWTPTRDGVRAQSSSTTYEADHLIVCSGSWSPKHPELSHIPITPRRQVQHWFEIAPEHYHDFTEDRFPIHIWDDSELFYCMPAINGPTGGVKCCREAAGGGADPDELQRTATAPEIAAVADRAGKYFPTGIERWVRAAPCTYPETPDNRFLIGPAPGSDRVWLATGLGGHGFKFTPAIGEAIANLITGSPGQETVLAPFSPSRSVRAAATTVEPVS